jgi:hypothetical protein
MANTASVPGRIVSHVSHERSCFLMIAISPTMPETSPHRRISMPKLGNVVGCRDASAIRCMNTAELTMFITMNAIAKPTAHQPSRVLGRFKKGELEFAIFDLLFWSEEKCSLAKPND